MPGAARSSLPMMDTWIEGLVGDATVTIQPMSIATSRPSRSTKKSRVSAGRSDLMLGTARLTVTLGVLSDDQGSDQTVLDWRDCPQRADRRGAPASPSRLAAKPRTLARISGWSALRRVAGRRGGALYRPLAMA